MYQYISRDDCYYKDMDSVILENPLPKEDISSKLGKFKFECIIKKDIFLEPKSYYLMIEDHGYKLFSHFDVKRALFCPEKVMKNMRNCS
uniref:DNA polymerase n=1 Tax=Cajanus cajan TaxID=3821 RepID=A0A151RQ13_CAJCA|nr:DNA polymerase [Cajanus cajan]